MAAVASSSVMPGGKYDVFLSFRGEDTRNNFTSHLYAALCRKKIETFIDNNLIRGDEISSSLLDAIKASKISVIILSKNYADSRWCLRELEQSLECKRRFGQIVIPVFYHVDPSHVRNQTDTFGEAFATLQERFNERLDELQRWKAALQEVANLSGWPSNDEMPESLLVEKTVGDIMNKLNKLSPCDNDGLVGVQFIIQKIVSLLCNESNGVCIVGIWGIGGIGKTTISHAVFNKILSQFEGSYFAENVREEFEKSSGLTHLRHELLSTILEDRHSNLGFSFTKERLGRKKILIVFDDVTYFEQIQKLIGDPNCLGSGSRIIITTRDKQVLKNCGVNDANIFEVERLCDDDALQLFSQYAFRQNCPTKEYMEISNKMVTYTKGLPLALKVLGSSLLSKGKVVWEETIRKLEKCPPLGIQKVLKISYDGLDREEKDIFLDIACFFKGEDKNLVIEILNACDFSIELGINVLVEKCLITMSKYAIQMHDLLQKMGKEIVREESWNNPGKHSRLWHHEDIYNVLKKNKGTEAIQGIRFDMSKTKEIELNPSTFAKMDNLRIFDFCCSSAKLEINYIPFSHLYCSCDEETSNKVRASQRIKFASSDLTYFRWHGYPLKTLPSRFHLSNLVALVMPHSNVKELWTGIQHLANLKHINLCYSKHLIKIPDLSLAPNLESLLLGGCTSLIEIHSSIQNLNKLVTLNLVNCKSLSSLPSSIHSKSLVEVFLSGCSNLKTAPTFPCSLSSLYLDGTAIREFPLIEQPSGLDVLNLEDCSRLESLPSSFGLCSLTILDLTGCQISELPDNLGQLYSIKELYLCGNNFESIPASIKYLSELQFLDLSGCERLRSIPELPKGLDINAYNCISLEELSDFSLSYLFSPKSWDWRNEVNLANCFKLNRNTIIEKVKYCLLRISGDKVDEQEFYRRGCICFPGNETPEWLSFNTVGSSMTIELPPDWNKINSFVFAMCVVVEFPDHFACNDFIVEYSWKTKSMDGDEIELRSGYLSAWSSDYFDESLAIQQDHVFLGYDLYLNLSTCVGSPMYDDCADLSDSNQVYIEFVASGSEWSYKVKKCSVQLLYAHDCMEATAGTSLSLNLGEKEEESMVKSNIIFNCDADEETEESLSKRLKISY